MLGVDCIALERVLGGLSDELLDTADGQVIAELWPYLDGEEYDHGDRRII
jgi:hypothetical protein